MKRMGRIAAFAVLCALLAAAPWAMRTAWVDVRERIRPRDTRWQGVISVGYVPTFSMESADGWLKACAKAFALENDNVLVSVREMTKVGVQTGAAAQALPDVLVFGAQVFDGTEREEYVQADSAQPVAAGAYALLGNRAVLEKAGWQQAMGAEETLRFAKSAQLRVAVPKREYADPLAVLGSMGEAGEHVVQESYARVWPDFALEEKYALYVATQREILRMQALRSGGRGFDAVVIVPEDPLGEDQTLVCAAVKPEYTARQDDAACEEWAEAWIRFLTEEAQQAELARAGLFSVKGDAGLYAEGHPLAEIEDLLLPCGRLS